jgi:hypothetical protein
MEKIDKNIYEGFDEKVDKFLKGMMSETEESEFKKELSANADLRQRAKAITILLKGLREKGRERDQKIIEEGHPHIKQCPAWKRIAVCACAAAIVGISTFKYIDYRHTSHLAKSQLHIAPNLTSRKSYVETLTPPPLTNWRKYSRK